MPCPALVHRLPFPHHRCWRMLALLPLLVGVGRAIGAESDDDLFALELDDLMQVQVTVASARGEALRETPVLVSRLDASEARQYGLQTLAEWLSMLPGVIEQDTAIGTEAVMMRGLVDGFNQKVLFLLDGVPYWQPTHGDIPLPAIPLSLISHIEIIRGPGGVIYGTNATAGVINVVTRRDDNREASLALGSHDSWRGESYQQYRVDQHILSLAVSASAGPAYDGTFTDRPVPGSFPPDTPRNGDVPRDKQQQSAFLHYQHGDLQLRWHGFETESDGLAGAAALINTSTLEYDGQQFSIDYQHDLNPSHRLQWFADATRYTLSIPTDRQLAGVTDGLQTFADDGDDNRRYRAGLRWQWTLAEQQFWQAGLVREQRRSGEYQLYNRANGNLLAVQMPADESNELAAYGQWDARFDAWRVVLGARQVDSEQFGAEWLPRGSLHWDFLPDHNLRLVYSEGYNAPTFLQLNVLVPPNAVIGNPALAPERIENLELAWSWQQPQHSLTVTAFRLDISDAIRRQQIPATTSVTYVNVEPFTRHGMEAEWRWQQRDWQWYGSAAWQREGNSDADGFAIQTPKYQFSFGSRYRLGAHRFGAALRYIGSRAVADPVRLLSLHYHYEQPRWQLSVDVSNALGDDQQHPDVQDQVPTRLVTSGPDEASASVGVQFRF